MYITRERTAMMAEFLDIPKGVGPLDLSIYATIKSYCRLFSDPNLMEKFRRLEQEISEFELDQGAFASYGMASATRTLVKIPTSLTDFDRLIRGGGPIGTTVQ